MKYILGILGVIVLLIVAIVLLATTNDIDTTEQEGEPQINLTEFTDSDAVVSWTEQGELVGVNEHKEVRVTVSRNERRTEILTGYDQAVERSQSDSNTQEGFSRFMHALENAGFSRERAAEQKDYRGVCPLGKRYIYTFRTGGSDKLFLWSTTCRNDEGTFGGDDDLVRRLFQNQIPNYRDFVRGVKL